MLALRAQCRSSDYLGSNVLYQRPTTGGSDRRRLIRFRLSGATTGFRVSGVFFIFPGFLAAPSDCFYPNLKCITVEAVGNRGMTVPTNASCPGIRDFREFKLGY